MKLNVNWINVNSTLSTQRLFNTVKVNANSTKSCQWRTFNTFISLSETTRQNTVKKEACVFYTFLARNISGKINIFMWPYISEDTHVVVSVMSDDVQIKWLFTNNLTCTYTVIIVLLFLVNTFLPAVHILTEMCEFFAKFFWWLHMDWMMFCTLMPGCWTFNSTYRPKKYVIKITSKGTT